MRTLFCFVFLMAALDCLQAYDDSPPCLKHIEQTFFTPYYVKQALSLHLINQGQWDPIVQELQYRSKDLHKMIRTQAGRQKPNPLDNPFNAEAAGKVVYDVLFQLFRDVCRHNNIFATDHDIQEMFRYIYERQQGLFEKCFSSPEK